MTRYRNGFVPAEALVTFASGWNADGYWEHRLPPASYNKHLALVARAHARTGRWLQITPGWNCDRPYAIQVQARERHGVWAATPGQSSHGGTWAGPATGWAWVDTAAIDYGNWSWVYQNHGGRAAWYDDCRAVGFAPGCIAPPSFPDEPWHTVDFDPWAPVPAGNGAENLEPVEAPAPPNVSEGADMIVVKDGSSGHVYAVGEGRLTHLGSTARDVAVNLYNKPLGDSVWKRDDSGVIVLPSSFFLALLDANGIPRSKAKTVLGRKTWSREDDVIAAVAKPTALTDVQVREIADMVAAAIPVAVGADEPIDYAAIADAVRQKFRDEPLT